MSHMDLDMAPCLHIITHMDMDMTPCLHICHFKFIIPLLVGTDLEIASMSAYYHSHGYGYGSMSA